MSIPVLMNVQQEEMGRKMDSRDKTEVMHRGLDMYGEHDRVEGDVEGDFALAFYTRMFKILKAPQNRSS